MQSVVTNHARTQRPPRPALPAPEDQRRPLRFPALSGHDLCYFHQKATADERPARFPVLEDANAIQVAVMIVMDAVYRHFMPHKTAAILLYGLQIASANLRYLQLTPDVKRETRNLKRLSSSSCDNLSRSGASVDVR